MKKTLYLLYILVMTAASVSAQEVQFEKFFADSTLRIDYIFSGTANTQQVSLDEIRKVPVWAGRRHNLDSLLLAGNAQLTMRDAATARVIYRHSFSTLFQEWQTTEEATRVNKSFENVFQVPMPHKPVDIEVTLYDVHAKPATTFVHRVDPTDILIRPLADPKHEVRHLLHSGSASDCIDIAIVSEGYTQEEMETFFADAKITCDELFNYEPFKSHRRDFNVVAVGAPSKESGVSIPGKNDWRQTNLSSNFDTFYSSRYLTTLRLKTLGDALAGVPYEHIIILANTDNYGGGGIYNSYEMTAAHHKLFKPVVVHEFGHSFAGLADEYAYDDQYTEFYYADTEPWELNITTLAAFETKWADMIPGWKPGMKSIMPRGEVPGLIEGAGYQSRGVYRAFEDCRMRTNVSPTFCPVCCRSIERVIDFYLR